jgi:two-component system, sensor histidine kinase and response regulator
MKLWLARYFRWPWIMVQLACLCALLTLWISLSTASLYQQVQRDTQLAELLTRMLALLPGSRSGVYPDFRALEAQVDELGSVPVSALADIRAAADSVQRVDEQRSRLERELGESEKLIAMKAIDEESALAAAALKTAISTLRTEQFERSEQMLDRVRILAGASILLVGLLAVIGWQLHRQRSALARRANVENELKSSKERFRGLLEHILEGVYQTNSEGRIIAANQSLVNMLGFESEDELKHAVVATELYPDPAQRMHFLELLEREGAIRNQELSLRRRDGQYITVLENSRVVRDANGKTLYYEGTLTNITERKAFEREIATARDQAIAASRLKSEFLANVSHEIRTPMNGVIGMTGLLLDTPLSGEQREYALAVRRSAEFLLGIINDILDFSKIEAGKLELERIELAVRTCVEDVLELLAEQAESRGLELAADIAEDVPNTILGDPGRLRQVITNLVGNAIKFTHDGEVVVRVALEAETPESVTLRFEVSDTGIGITPEQMERIFDPFTQGDGSTTRKYGGTGLGLSISRRIVELMNGRIEASSEVGRGSTFRFSAQFAPAASSAGENRSLSAVQLFMVGSNGLAASVLSSHARRWGMQVRRGFEAQAVRGGGRAVVVVDAEGYRGSMEELLADVRSVQDAAVRAYLLTNFGRRSTALNDPALRGINGIITKPVRLEKLRLLWTEELGRIKVDESAVSEEVSRVLVAEDNEVNQMVARRLVEKLGYSVDVVTTGTEAVEAVERRLYSLVLMDCQMPEMDGFDATAEIRRRENGITHLPIIAMTAHAVRGDRERCLEAGMDDYLPKPISANDLQAMLSRWAPRPAARAAARGATHEPRESSVG